MNVLSTALSGLQAAQARMNSAAHNVANAQTEGFRREQVVTSAQAHGGTTAQLQKLPPSGADITADLVEQQSASYAWRANLQTIKTVDTLVGSLLNAKA